MHRTRSPDVRRFVAVHRRLLPISVVDDLLAQWAGSPWALVTLAALVVGDAFLVVIPGEAAVTALGALAAATGSPPLILVILIASGAAFAGDAGCYVIGRAVGDDRWRWMRHPRVHAMFGWARARLDRSTAAIVFTARFIPFARLAVNLTAGASGISARRYLPIAAAAATGWALYQVLIGAAIGWMLPGNTVAAVLISILVAFGLGAALDAVLSRRAARNDGPMTVSVTAAGYDESFLAVPLPIPRPLDRADVEWLTYPRFSVALDTRRRLAVVTGVNIDGQTLQDLPRTGDWELDARVSPSEQAGPEIYAANDLDRGHLVRRRDPGWGTASEARTATEATFVYTNAAPQAAAFNQSKDLWLGIEDHVLEFADAEDLRVSVFTAPVLADGDPVYRGIGIPRRFWKIAAWTGVSPEGEQILAAAGFLLDQSDLIDLESGAMAVPSLGSFRTFQVPIADIAELADVDAGPLVAADVMPATGAGLTAEWVELADSADIRV